MKTLLAFLSCALFLAVPAPVATLAEPDRVLWAIAQVESGGHPHAVGKRGERGIYQISQAVWYHYTNRPHAEAAKDAALNDAVARAYLLDLRGELQRRQIAPTTYALALAWNAGPVRAARGDAPKAAKDFAARVSALAERSGP